MILSVDILSKLTWTLLSLKDPTVVGRINVTDSELPGVLAPIVLEHFHAVIEHIDIVVQPIKSNSALNENSTGNLYIPLSINDSTFLIQETSDFKYQKIGAARQLHSFGSADRFHLVNASVRDRVILLELKVSTYDRTNNETFPLGAGTNTERISSS